MKVKKLTRAQTCLLWEAYRRLHIGDEVEARKPMTQKWLGLGTHAAYKPVLDAGLMEFVSPPPPRCMGWLHLTPLGEQALCQLEPEFAAEMKRLMEETAYPWTVQANYMLAGGITT